MSIGQRIKSWREQRELSQRWFADVLSHMGFQVDASAVSRIEADARDLRVSELITIAEALAVEPSVLIQGLSTSPESKQSYAAGYRDGITVARRALNTL